MIIVLQLIELTLSVKISAQPIRAPVRVPTPTPASIESAWPVLAEAA